MGLRAAEDLGAAIVSVAVAALLAALGSMSSTPPRAALAPRGTQDPIETKPAATYTKEEFKADREIVLAAIRESDAFAKKSDYRAATEALDKAIGRIRPASLQATLWSTRADLNLVQAEFSQVGEDIVSAERLLANIDEATRRKEGCDGLAYYLCTQRSQLYLEWGLVDLAHDWISRAKEMLDRATRPESGGRLDRFDRVWITADYVDACVLGSMEDWAALELSITAALQRDVYTRYPDHKLRLLERLGLGLKEAARTKPADADRARALLEAAAVEPKRQASARILPELGLAELDYRASNWAGAQKHIKAAAEAMGAPERREEAHLYAAWLASSARLLVDRPDVAPSKDAWIEMRGKLERALARGVEESSQRELRPGGHGPLHGADQRSLISELLRLDVSVQPGAAGIEAALSHLLSTESTGTLARKLAVPATSLAGVRALVGRTDDHALLVYFPAPYRTHLFVVRPDSIEQFLLPERDAVEAARSDAERSMQRPIEGDSREWQTRERDGALTRLADLLLPKQVLDRLKGCTHWTIVGGDLLGPVPFEALSPYGACLGTTHAITRLPSLAIGARLAARSSRQPASAEQSGAGAVLLLSAPLGAQLDLADSAVDEVIATYPATTRRLLVGRAGTLASLRQAAPSATVAQLIAHGRYDAQRERPAGMMLVAADGGAEAFVGAEELETLDAPPLVVLTVCGAARAPKRRGDAGAADLVGALLSAGDRARCVVLSSYDLDVEAARQLSIRFHTALVHGESPSEALRTARAALARDPHFADPFHHALVVAVGLGHEPLFGR